MPRHDDQGAQPRAVAYAPAPVDPGDRILPAPHDEQRHGERHLMKVKGSRGSDAPAQAVAKGDAVGGAAAQHTMGPGNQRHGCDGEQRRLGEEEAER